MDRFHKFTSRGHTNNSVPEVPRSLRSESFELSDIRKVQKTKANNSPYITPYLGLRSRLSQIWINRWTILLLLVLVRVVILIGQLNSNVDDAKDKALSACTKVEDLGSAMASMPHYLSLGVNNMAATGIEKAVDAMLVMLDLLMTGVEAMIYFFISFMVGTYTCLLTALVHGALDVVASVTEDATKAFNTVIDSATGEIQTISGGLEKTLNDITKGIEDSIFGSILPEIPTVNFTEPINKLKSFDIKADDFVKDVRKLNDDIPTFDEVQNMTKEAIAIPFNFVRKALNDSYGNYKFNRDVFPLAQKEKLTFCSNNDSLNGFFDGLFSLIAKAKIIFIVVLSLLAIAAIAPMAWLEIKRWRMQQRHAKLIDENRYDSMDVVYISSRSLTSTLGIKFGSRFTGKRQILARWCFAYATSTPALFVLSLAIAGFFSCLCQVIMLQAVKNEVPALAQEVGLFADNVVSSINSVSEEWATDANGIIKGLNSDINDDVLSYVTNATSAVNKTINVFMDTMDDGLQTVFNGTVLLDPIKTVIHCVIGLKIESLQKGLTWVHDNSKITLPLFANDTFSLGAKESLNGDSDLNSFLASPSSVTTDEVSGAVQKVTDWMHRNIVQEALISLGILLAYIIVVLIGVTRALAGMAMRGEARPGVESHYNEDGEAQNTQGHSHDHQQGQKNQYQHRWQDDGITSDTSDSPVHYGSDVKGGANYSSREKNAF
uniref:Plasma membrane fusion protein PRM1 n=1 Tax=Bionectria ochroleuca TaxID=29856 RepID=A0A8H7NLE6_BIOOC